AGHGAEISEGPVEGQGSAARHAAVSGARPGDSATHAGADDAAAGLAANREADQARRSSGARTGAGARRAFLREPRVHRLPAEPNIVERQGAETELCYEHGTRGVQTLDDRGGL